jgi:hypothetical protein
MTYGFKRIFQCLRYKCYATVRTDTSVWYFCDAQNGRFGAVPFVGTFTTVAMTANTNGFVDVPRFSVGCAGFFSLAAGSGSIRGVLDATDIRLPS